MRNDINPSASSAARSNIHETGLDPREVSYSISKHIPDMSSGFNIQTHYGELEIMPPDINPNAQKIIDAVENYLKNAAEVN